MAVDDNAGKPVRVANPEGIALWETAPRYVQEGVQKSRVQPLPHDFYPDDWCFHFFEKNGIPKGFVESQLADFKEYWLGRGEGRKHWPHKFVKYVNQQWAHINGEQKLSKAQRQALDVIDRGSFPAMSQVFSIFQTAYPAQFQRVFPDREACSSALRTWTEVVGGEPLGALRDAALEAVTITPDIPTVHLFLKLLAAKNSGTKG